MEFDIRQERGISIVTASGELDAAKSPELEKVFASWKPEDAPRKNIGTVQQQPKPVGYNHLRFQPADKKV